MEKLNVAIADDNEKMIDLLETLIKEDNELELVGHANNGADIYDIIKEKEPDVVLLDIIMPKVDGLTVMERVGKDCTIKKHPAFIVVSAVGQEQITEDAFNLGANYYVLKPFDNGMLPFLFSAMTMDSVSKAANKMIEEVRRQFKTIPGIMEGKGKPDYSSCVEISTQAALKEMMLPGLMAVAAPLLCGIILGSSALGGLLAGALVTGVCHEDCH